MICYDCGQPACLSSGIWDKDIGDTVHFCKKCYGERVEASNEISNVFTQDIYDAFLKIAKEKWAKAHPDEKAKKFGIF